MVQFLKTNAACGILKIIKGNKSTKDLHIIEEEIKNKRVIINVSNHSIHTIDFIIQNKDLSMKTDHSIIPSYSNRNMKVAY